jgi:hypothetical protein
MRALVLTLLVGCAAGDGEPAESQFASAVTACPSSTWCVEASPSSNRLLAVWAASADDVFAVGEAGTILHRANNTWTAMASPMATKLRGLWGTSASDVWAGGVGGVVLHWDGTAWSSVTGAGTTDIWSIWASGPSDVWFVGTGGVVLRWNGAALSAGTVGGNALQSVSGTGPTDVWVTGDSANARHLTSAGWNTLTPGVGTSSLQAVLAVGPSDVWVSDATPGKETAHWNGSKWTTVKSTPGIWTSMSALSTSDIWGVGITKTGHWDGSAWTVTTPFSATLWGVTTQPGNLWVVGDGGLIAHRSL